METNRFLNLGGSLLCLTIVFRSTLALAEDDIKYILLWGNSDLYPSSALGVGSSAFIQHKCVYRNCFVTSDIRRKDVTEFDAIVFNGRELGRYAPRRRSEKQKYVYINMESSYNYPLCNKNYNNFFNWTWTYKLNSDAWWGYIRVNDLNGVVVGPKIDMHWSKLGAVDNQTKSHLQHKKVAAAWFVSNCDGPNTRQDFVETTAQELQKYGQSIHIYGKCGDYSCPRSMSEKCNKIIADDYFFYLAFENSFADDYVTEKVLTGLQNYAVPVVFGDANYSRFLPPGSYLPARQLGPEGLATRMASIIASYKRGQREIYYDFFRWRSKYKIEVTSEKEFVCRACSDLNNPDKMAARTTYPNITDWWNSKHAKCKAENVKVSLWMLIFVRVVDIYTVLITLMSNLISLSVHNEVKR